MQHPDEGLIHEWLDGELNAAEAARVETLVANDPAWAAAAADARGVMAAASRVVGALDRGSVLPAERRTAPGPARFWIWRDSTLRAAAAILVVVTAGVVAREQWFREPAVGGALPAAATTLMKTAPPTPSRRVAAAPSRATASAPSTEPTAVRRSKATSPSAPATGSAQVAAEPAPSPTSPSAKVQGRLQDVAGVNQESVGAATRGDVRGVGARAEVLATAKSASEIAPPEERRRLAEQARAAAPPASNAASGGSAARDAAADRLAASSLSREIVRCFQWLAPPDSAARVVRISISSFADSVRAGAYAQRADTVFVRTRPVWRAITCPDGA